MKKDDFNIIIAGTGGQGLITLLKIIAQAAFDEGYDVKTSELHGLSQRGGSVEVHIRFGKGKVYSPLVKRGGANLIISLEAQEALRVAYFASKEAGTVFLINEFFIPVPEQKMPTIKEISDSLKNFSKKTIVVSASDICQKTLGQNVTAGIYLLGYSSFKNLLPLSPERMTSAIKKIIPANFLELNLKSFELAKR